MNLVLSDSVISFDGSSSKSRIKPLNALAEVFEDKLPEGPIKDILDLLETHVRNVAEAKELAQPTSSAFSNTRGLWFEIIVSVYSWNYRITNGLTDLYAIKMPNVKMYDFRRIFNEQTARIIEQLESYLRNHDKQLRLVASNPDIIIVQQKGLVTSADDYINNLSLKNTERIIQLCNEIRDRCQWSSVRAGIGLTTSLRPDRRLQLVHEGNILKALFAHLKMRHWNNNVSFEYHGASSEKRSHADDEALKTVATHSIVNVNSIPERAVDGVHSLLNTDDIYTMLDKIIKRKTSV